MKKGVSPLGKKRSDSPYLIMSVLLILWGSFAAVSKLALNTLDNFQIQFYMFGSALAIYTAAMALSGKIAALFSLSAKEVGKLVWTGLPFYFYYLFYILSLSKIPVVEASMLNYLFPLFIVLLSVPMFGERLTPAGTLSILLGFAGMSVIVSDGDWAGIRLTDLTGDLLAVAGAFCWALFSVWGKKNRTQQDLGLYLYTLTAFVLSAAGVLVFSEFAVPDYSGLGASVWLAVSNIVLGNALWFRGLRSSNSSLIAALSYLTPFITLLFIVVLLGERISAAQAGGFLVILAGIALQAFSGRQRARKTPQTEHG